MVTNIVESFNAWLKNKRHHSIYSFLMEHMIKLGGMLVKHKEESMNWKGSIGPKFEYKDMVNINKVRGVLVSPFMNSRFGISIWRALFIIDLVNRTCTCNGWEMLGIPYEHSCVVIQAIGKNVANFVDDWFTFPKQELIYSGFFC